MLKDLALLRLCKRLQLLHPCKLVLFCNLHAQRALCVRDSEPLHDTLMMHRDFWTVVLSSFIGQQLKLLLSVLKLCCSISQLACMLLVKELLQVWAGRAFSAAGGFVRLLSSSVNMWGGCPLELQRVTLLLLTRCALRDL